MIDRFQIHEDGSSEVRAGWSGDDIKPYNGGLWDDSEALKGPVIFGVKSVWWWGGDYVCAHPISATGYLQLIMSSDIFEFFCLWMSDHEMGINACLQIRRRD